MIEFPNNHSDFTFRTEKGIHSKSYVHLPLIKWIFWYDNIFLKRLHSLFKFIGNMSRIKSRTCLPFKVLGGRWMRICEINFSADIVMKVFFLLLARSLKKKVTLSSSNSVILYSAIGERARYLPRYLIISFVLLMSPSPTLKKNLLSSL